MPTFKDNAGREWTLTLTLADVVRVKRQAKFNIVDGFDLGTKAKRNIFTVANEDPEVLFDVLYVLCKPQCDERNITGEQFAEGLFGESLEAATTALLEALCDFFQPSKRKVLRALWKRMQARQSAMTDEAIEQAASVVIDRVMSQSLTSVLNSPESVELTPTGEPCVN